MNLKKYRQRLYDELPRSKCERQKICLYTGMLIHPNLIYRSDIVNVDHVLPKALGGTDKVDNLLLVYSTTNYEKADMRLADYLDKIGQFHKFIKRLKSADISLKKKKHLRYCLYASY